MADGGKQLLHEDGETMVIRHEDGSTIKIAKRGLHKYAQEQLRGMCGGGTVKGYADGGQVEPSIADLEAGVAAPPVRVADPFAMTAAEMNARNAQAARANAALAAKFGVEAAPPVVVPPPAPEVPATAAPPYLMQPNAAAMPAPAPAAAAQPAMQLPGFDQYMADVRANQQKFMGMGGTGEARRASQASEKIASDAQSEYVRQQGEMAARQKQYDADVKSFLGEYQAAVDDFKSAKIDPNRFWSTRTDGQKVSAMVGLILGGLGSGLTGQPNAAMQLLERAIDRDFEAQRADMGKKANLVSMLHQKFGTMEAAQNAFRMYKAAEISAYANKTAAQLGGAQARMHAAQIEQTAAQFATQNAMQLANIKFQRDMMQQMLGQMGVAGQQAGAGARPTMPEIPGMEPYAKAYNADTARMITAPDGKGQVLAHPGMADKARERLAGASSAEEILRKLDQVRKSGSTAVWGTDANREYERLRETLIQDVARMQGIGTDAARKDIGGMLPGSAEQLVRGRVAFDPIWTLIHSNKRAIYKDYAGLNVPDIAAPEHKAR